METKFQLQLLCALNGVSESLYLLSLKDKRLKITTPCDIWLKKKWLNITLTCQLTQFATSRRPQTRPALGNSSSFIHHATTLQHAYSSPALWRPSTILPQMWLATLHLICAATRTVGRLAVHDGDCRHHPNPFSWTLTSLCHEEGRHAVVGNIPPSSPNQCQKLPVIYPHVRNI